MNLGICVLACSPVSVSSPLGGRVEDRLVIEPQGELQILLLAGEGVEVGQGLVHAAVLVAEHRLHLLVAQPVGAAT